eukprot:858024_1
MTSPVHLETNYSVKSKNVDLGKEFITSNYLYRSTKIHKDDTTGETIVEPIDRYYMFKTDRRIPKLGVLLVGIGGNNGTTVLGGILANKYNITWNNKQGIQTPNYFGSLSQSTT